MLFGNEEIRKQAIAHATDMAKEENGKIIYGVTMGSLAKGYQSVDSDYDVRFLYVKNDFPHTLYLPAELDEKEMVKRFYEPTDAQENIPMDRVFDRIALWEASSFLHLLLTPTFKSKTYDPFGLYHTVEFTMYSPFTWDPYGLQFKLLPFLQKSFNLKLALSYYKSIIDRQYIEKEGKSRLSEYARCIWVSIAIQWVIKEKSPSPIYVESMLPCLDIQTQEAISKYLADFQNRRKKYLEESSYTYRTMGNAILTDGDPILNNFIEKSAAMAEVFVATLSDLSEEEINKRKKLLHKMYSVIDNSVNNCLVVPGVND